MSRFSIFRRDDKGSTVVEFAIALPVLVMLIWGIFQVGLLFWASAGMQHALGEGARYATIYPTPTDSQIASRISAKVFGTQNGTFVVTPITTGAGFKNLSVTYTTPTNFLFMTGPTVSLTRSKKVYVAV